MSLVTLADIKTFLGISGTDQDALLTMFQESVEASVINYCETDFTPQVITGTPGEILDATRADVIVPRGYPITAVAGVWLGVDPDGTGGFQLDASDFYFTESAIYLQGIHTPFQRGAIRLNYTWGYASVPGDVKMAVYQSIKAEMQRYNRNTEDLSSRSKQDESESYGGGSGAGSVWDPLTGLPRTIVAKLQPYRNYEFPRGNMAQRNL